MTYDWADDSYRAWSLSVAVRRERGVRSGMYRPISEREKRQAKEGPRPDDQLDCVQQRSDA